MKAIIFAIFGVLISYSAALSDEKELTAEEQKELYNNTKLHTIVSNGYSVWVEYNSNGTMKGTHEQGWKDEGTFYIKGRKYCRTWNKWNNNNFDCHRNFYLGDGWYKSIRESDGKVVKFEIVGD